jgi:hypothetical protein
MNPQPTKLSTNAEYRTRFDLKSRSLIVELVQDFSTNPWVEYFDGIRFVRAKVLLETDAYYMIHCAGKEHTSDVKVEKGRRVDVFPVPFALPVDVTHPDGTPVQIGDTVFLNFQGPHDKRKVVIQDITEYGYAVEDWRGKYDIPRADAMTRLSIVEKKAETAAAKPKVSTDGPAKTDAPPKTSPFFGAALVTRVAGPGAAAGERDGAPAKVDTPAKVNTPAEQPPIPPVDENLANTIYTSRASGELPAVLAPIIEQLFDVKDRNGKYYQAIIVNHQGDMLEFTFPGYRREENVKLPVTSPNISPLHTHTLTNLRAPSGRILRAGDAVDVYCDTHKQWFASVLAGVSETYYCVIRTNCHSGPHSVTLETSFRETIDAKTKQIRARPSLYVETVDKKQLHVPVIDDAETCDRPGPYLLRRNDDGLGCEFFNLPNTNSSPALSLPAAAAPLLAAAAPLPDAVSLPAAAAFLPAVASLTDAAPLPAAAPPGSVTVASPSLPAAAPLPAAAAPLLAATAASLPVAVCSAETSSLSATATLEVSAPAAAASNTIVGELVNHNLFAVHYTVWGTAKDDTSPGSTTVCSSVTSVEPQHQDLVVVDVSPPRLMANPEMAVDAPPVLVTSESASDGPNSDTDGPNGDVSFVIVEDTSASAAVSAQETSTETTV